MFEPVFDHSDFAIFVKPPGVSVHSEAASGFVAQLQQQRPEHGWHLVHRLDKATSGLLILAKSALAAARFGEMFAQHTIDKFYLSLAEGLPIKKQGLVMGDMERSRNGQWKLTRHMKNPAITQFLSVSIAPGRRLYLLRPRTGKTHQLRVAHKALGVPILGDERYGKQAADRMYLQAFALSFCWNDEVIAVTSVPQQGEHFAQIGPVLDQNGWGQPWQLPWPRLPATAQPKIMP